MKVSRLLMGLFGVIGCSVVVAQTFDLPKRKPGLWEMKMESAQHPNGAMTSLQCIDEATDAEMQKKMVSGNGKSDCKMTSFKKTTMGWEFDSVCHTEKQTISGHVVVTGDMQSAYQMDMVTRMDPPLNGQAELRNTMKLKNLGACKPGMKPGDMSINGMTFNTLSATGGGKTTMSKEDMQRMVEEMKKAKQAK